MGMSLTILAWLASLAVSSLAIFLLAQRTGHGLILKVSGILASGLGLWIFFYSSDFLPHSKQDFASALAFGTAYLGQSLIVLFIAFKSWPMIEIADVKRRFS